MLKEYLYFMIVFWSRYTGNILRSLSIPTLLQLIFDSIGYKWDVSLSVFQV